MKLTLIGIILMGCGLVAIYLSDLLAVWFCFCFGIWLIIIGMRSNNSSKQQAPPTGLNVPEQQNVPPMPAPEPKVEAPKPLYERAGLPKPTKTLTLRVAGGTFKCLYSDAYDSRQDILEFVKAGERVSFRQYTYKGKPAIALIHDISNADMGVVPAEMTEKVLGYLNQYDVVGLVKDPDFFVKEKEIDEDEDLDFDSDDYEDEIDEYIYTCKVLLCAYKRLEVK